MSRSRFVLTLLVVALLSAVPALPQSRRGEAPPRSASFSEALQGFLPGFLTRLWAEAGCGFDPYGGCLAVAARPAVRPSHNTAVWAEAGCGVDPYGGCSAQPSSGGGH